MKAAEIIACLRRARLFRVLSPKDLQQIASASQVAQYEADATIFFRGDPPDQVYLVLEGQVAVETMSSEGRTIAITSIGPGEVFGEMAILDGRERSANIRTLTPTTLLLINNSKFHSLLQEHSAFSYEVIQDLVRRLRQSDDQIEALMFLSLRRRLANLLLSMFQSEGPVLKVTQADLAYRLTATREKVNVNLQVLQDAGAIKLGRGRITLLDADILARIR